MKAETHVEDRQRPGWLTNRPTGSQYESSQILVADDQPGCRLAFRLALEASGYEVAEAEDGERALESLRDDAADLALLDLRMPGLDGLGVLQSLRDEDIDVPVVIVTAHGEVPTAVRAIELGALDFLAKPVDPVRLRETVLDVLLRCAGDGPRSIRPAPASPGGEAYRFADTLAVARRTMKLGHFELAACLLQQALDIDPCSVEANTLRGEVHEGLGEHRAACRSYRRALARGRYYGPAVDGLRRCLERSDLDHHDRAINPGEE